MKRFASLFITLFLVIACQSQVDVTQTIPANTATPEITLTSTSQSTIPPQATPTQNLSIEFPDWVKNPDTQILLVPVGTHEKGYENMALFNAETGERFDVPFTDEVGDYFWLPDGSAFGFLQENKNQIILFSIKDSYISNVLLSKESLKFFDHDSDVDSIQLTSSNITDPDLLVIPSWYLLSPDRNYFEYQEERDDTYTSIFDVSKNEIINISDPNDEYFDLFSEFSPDSNFLAIVEVDEESGCCYRYSNLPTFRLRIYDIHSQEVVSSYKNVTFPKWSPDGTKFLFQEWKQYYASGWWHAKSPPCIFNTLDSLTNCYNETITRQGIHFSSVNWSPDQTMIGYVGDGDGFCTINLISMDLQCILEHLDIEGQNIIRYTWSPDSNFISFIYDTSCPYCDYSDFPKLGIANIQTGEYFPIGDNVHYFNLGLWRPSSNP